jgi:uncharacterized coiled-coil protein SlyX
VAPFGLLAEEVAKVDADLVARDDKGKPCTVRYDAVSAMLLNEFLKQHPKVEEQSVINGAQNATNREFEATLAQQNKEIDELIVKARHLNQRLISSSIDKCEGE